MNDRGANKSERLVDIMDQIGDASGGDDEMSVQDLLDQFEGRVFGPLLLVPGLLAVSPLGAIPVVPTVLGLLTILVASQALVGRKHPWVPKKLREHSVSQDKVEGALDKARPWAKRIDRWLKPRLSFLVAGPARYVAAGLAVVLAITMPPLELIPFAVFVPGLGLVMLGLAVSAKDGVLGIAALLFALGTIGLAVWWFFLK